MNTQTSGTHSTPSCGERSCGCRVYRPLVDIVETKDELTLQADVPGVKNDAIEISFEDGVLTVQGKVEPRSGEAFNFLVREYGVGDFHRTFRLSEQINAAGIHAEYADGVLSVHLPKVEAVKPRKIEVKAG